MSEQPTERRQRKLDPRWAGIALIVLGLSASLLAGLCASTFGNLPMWNQFVGALRLFGLLILVGLFMVFRRWDHE